MLRFFCFLFFSSLAFAEISDLCEELDTARKIDESLNRSLPLLINSQLQGGYFAMPSARTYDEGVVSTGFSHLPPYRVWSAGFQFFNHIEATGNYWVYDGVESFPGMGFGDDAERSANLKCILLRKEDGFPFVPDIAVGWNDFFGSKRFSSVYVVATKELIDLGLEVTAGWGSGRIKGFFGGVGWTPWQRKTSFLRSLTLAAEYDANNYRYHPFEHHAGRSVKSRINGGVQANLWDLISLSASSCRGEKLAARASFHYNLGGSKGLFPKIFDKPPYSAEINTEPVGLLRSRKELASEIAFALKDQGFELSRLFLVPGEKDRLWMRVVNMRYRKESEVRERLETLLAALTPSDLEGVTVVMEADGIDEHAYRFRNEDLKRYQKHLLGEKELSVLSPMEEIFSAPTIYNSALLYNRKKGLWFLTARPWMRSFLGSAQGKFKYETGVNVGLEGYLLGQLYYSAQGNYTAFASTQDLKAQDTLNPSRIINVRTDLVKYNQANSLQLSEAFVQRSFALGSGWFTRAALGYFEPAYGGLALEALYYPVGCNWAVGFEGASLLKRRYSGIRFTDKVRRLLESGEVVYETFYPVQYFLDLYYQFQPLSLDFKASIGRFLAKDKGCRLEASRHFSSGLRVGLWWTFTNAKDVVNQERYYDKGVSISMPLEIFLNRSSRSRIGYSLAAWLRDCGAKADTGKALYPTLYWERASR